MRNSNVFCVNYEERLAAVNAALDAAEQAQHREQAESLRLAQAVLCAVLADRVPQPQPAH